MHSIKFLVSAASLRGLGFLKTGLNSKTGSRKKALKTYVFYMSFVTTTIQQWPKIFRSIQNHRMVMVGRDLWR